MPADAIPDSPSSPLVSVIVVPRERFSLSLESLDALYENTEPPFELVYVDGGSPSEMATQLRSRARDRGFALVRSDRHLTPNEARNVGASRAAGRYLVFVDNDLFVQPGWLNALVQCAEATGAAVVGPLYYEGRPEDEIIHMAGGDLTIEGDAPHRTLTSNHRYAHTPRADIERLDREPVDFVEFHCMLVRHDVFSRLGPFDEGLMCTREHMDWCMQVAGAGEQVFVEPESVVTYTNPPPFARYDVPFYWRRWSVAWTRASLDRFCDKYGLDDAYKRNVAKASVARRLRVFQPVSQRVHQTFGDSVGNVFDRGLRVLEPPLNRVLVRRQSARSQHTKLLAESRSG